MKHVVKSVIAAALVFSSSAFAWESESIITPNPRIGTMFSWWAGTNFEDNSLVVNCLSTGGAWLKLNTPEGGYQIPKLADYPAIVKLEIGDADGTSYFDAASLKLWNKDRTGDLQSLIFALNRAISIMITTDDGKVYRLRVPHGKPMMNTSVCKPGYPAMVNPASNTTYTPEEMANM